METVDEHGVPPGPVTRGAGAAGHAAPVVSGRTPWWQSAGMSGAGWAVSLGVGVWLLWSAAGKLLGTAAAMEELARLGQPAGSARAVGAVQLLGVAAYLYPRTAVVGAVLITAYMGGGAALHLNAGESVLAPVAAGIGAWLGLVLRDSRVRAVVPWRPGPAGHAPQSGLSHRRI